MFIFTGCVEEKIDASFPVERIEDQINHRSGVSISIPIERVQVDNQFGNVGDLQARTIGQVFRRLAEMLADVEIQRGQAGAINLGPYQYTLNELEGVDFNYIKEILVQRVQLKIGPTNSIEKNENAAADFSFIKSLEIFIRFDDEAPDLEQAYLALSYVKGQDFVGCAGKCLDLKIHKVNWKERLKNNKSFSVMMKVNVDKAPKQDFSFVGFINIAVTLNLGL